MNAGAFCFSPVERRSIVKRLTRSAALTIGMLVSPVALIAQTGNLRRADSVVAIVARADSTKPADSAPATAKTVAAVPKWFDEIAVNAFVSTAYQYNANRPTTGTSSYRVFDFNDNSFNLDVAEVVVQIAPAKPNDAGFRVDIAGGNSVPEITKAQDQTVAQLDLQQVFASYIAPLGAGLRFDVGKYVTHLGYELIEGYDGYNDNYSRSLLFNYAIPLTHTGVKASYSLTPKVSVMAMVANGWDVAIDNNASKSVGLQLAVKPIDPVALYVNYIAGPENSDDNHSIRQVIDLIGTLTVNSMLSLGVNADFGSEDGTSTVVIGKDAKWSGVAGYAKISTPSPFSLGLRAETFKDDGGTRLGLGEARANEFTVTPSFKFGSNLVLRAEGRYDWVNQAVFMDDKNVAKKNQATVGLNAIWVY